tara:strand:- start:54 stop:578 length:525 start_codon:yes stop_codon:yes gene_type:complete
MIKVLHNPKTRQYVQFKDWVFSSWIPWYWDNGTILTIEDGLIHDGHENFGFNFHTLLSGPGDAKYSIESSMKVKEAYVVLDEIIKANDLDVDVVYRMGINCVHPTVNNLPAFEHVDHSFPHKNMLIYMSDTDGDTVVGEDRHSPVEDEIIIFEGKHYHHPPTFGRRIVMVATIA